MKIRGELSGSLAARVIPTETSSPVVTVWDSAVGASFGGRVMNVSVPSGVDDELPDPSVDVTR